MADNSPLRKALSMPVMRRSIVIALIVGTILVAINQGDLLVSGQGLVWWKVGLTYLVAFLVSTYGAWSMARSMSRSKD